MSLENKTLVHLLAQGTAKLILELTLEEFWRDYEIRKTGIKKY